MSESSLRTHEKWIHNVNKDVIQCPHCGLKMQHKKYLRRHLEKECNPTVRPFKCPYCGADYKQKFSLTRHINSQCAKAKSSNNVAPVAPNPPSSGVSIQAQATSYVPILPKLPMEPLPIVYIDASEPKVNQEEPIMPTETRNSGSSSRPFKCPYCPADYVHSRSLSRHINTQCTNAKSNEGSNSSTNAITEPLPIVYVDASEEPKVPPEEAVLQLPTEPLPIVYIDTKSTVIDTSQTEESEEPMLSSNMPTLVSLQPEENESNNIEIKEELVAELM